MPRRWIALCVVGLVVGLALAASLLAGDGESTRIPYGDRAAVEKGRTVYEQACASCHGANLEGQPKWRQRQTNGRLPAPPHDASGHTWHHPDQQLFEITKYGTAKFAPPGYESDMPGFEDQLSDREILASLAYIKSTWPPDIQRRHSQMSAMTR